MKKDLKIFVAPYLYLALFLEGATVLIIEIAGTRVIAPFYGSTIFVWSSLITISLGFLALGYMVGGFLGDKYPQAKLFYLLLFGGGAAMLLLIKLNEYILVFSDNFGLRLGPLIAAALLFSLPLCLLGTAGPFAIRLFAKNAEHSGHVSGLIFGLSTVGSLAGALLAGFYLVPNFLLANIFVTSAITIMVAAILGLILEKSSWFMIIFAILALFVLFIMPFIKYKGDQKISVIHHEPSFYGDIKIIEKMGEFQKERCMLVNGAAQTCVAVENNVPTAVYLVELALLSQSWPKDTKILLLGLGGGGFLKIMRPSFAIDIVEIDPKIAELAKNYFGLALDGNDALILDDARSYLRKTNKKYDIILSDLYLGHAMPIHLFTKEAIQIMRQRLNENGVLISNLIGDLQVKNSLISSLVRTEAEVFPKIIVSSYGGEGLSNILAHAALNSAYKPDFQGLYRETAFDYKEGIVIADNKNPLDLLLTERLGAYVSDIIKKNFGYQPLFSI